MFFPILIITCKLQLSRYNGKSSTTLHCHNPLKRHTVDIRQYGTEKLVTPVGHDFTKSNTYIRFISRKPLTAWTSNLFMAMGRNCYCGLVRGQQV
jgi:hypothetical protein